MSIISRISQQFHDSAQLKIASVELLAAPIASAIELIVAAIGNDRKLLICGNGGSAGDSQHFAAELVGRFEREREELAAIALTTDSSIMTAIANDYSFDEVFAKQVRALGKPGDILFAISTSGNSKNVVAAIEAAHKKGLRIIGMTGRSGGRIGDMTRTQDVLLNVDAPATARIQEVHLLTLHCLCDAIDQLLFGEI